MSDPTFSPELADGALEWAESLYGTVPPYRDGWAHIHPQDREDWLDGFRGLREPLDQLAAWRAGGRLSGAQADRHTALLALKEIYDPVIRDLALRVLAPPPEPIRSGGDDYDLL
ncbi:MAG: hypothetical protein FJZ01_11805 [Candidatus Sericytochromatia bacterium]|nr:hypothetical protein [Candidatus Tanganyikabacteria bacterium]